MPLFLSWLGATVSLLTLLASGAVHLAQPERFASGLSAQGLSAISAARIRRWFPMVELVAAAAIGVSLLFGDRTRLALSSAAAGSLFLVLAAYAFRSSRAKPGAPCGCGFVDAPMSGWVVVRAGILAALAFLGAASALTAESLEFEHLLDLALLALGSLAVSTGVWVMPAALFGMTVASRPGVRAS